MGTQKRYAQRGDDATLQRMLDREPCPVTLPPQAWGPYPMDWTRERVSVWVWVQWTEKVAERRGGVVKGYNDRVVNVVVEGPGGGWDVVVWRNAVSHRREPPPAAKALRRQ